MGQGDIDFKVSATFQLRKSKFEADVKKATRKISPLEKAMRRAKAGAIVAGFQLDQFTKKQKAAERASEQAARAEVLAAKARERAERDAARMAAKRSREMERLARQARRAEIALSRLKHKGIARGFGTAQGMMAGMGGRAAMGGIGRVAAPAAMVAGGAATLGLGAALVIGLRFNKTMEDTRNSVATMFQMFDVGKTYFQAGQGEATVFKTNIALAKEAVDELMVLQQETPAGFTQVAQVFGQGIAGLAKGTKDVKRMLDLTTKISMMGPSLNSDYGQLGRDTMRILSGSAEQEVQVWRLLKEEFREQAVALGMLKSGLDDEKFVKQFNKALTAAQRMELFEKSMAKLGPEFEDMFRKSMSGLLSSTASKLSIIAGAFTGPLYNSFLKFLGRINLDTMLSGNMVQRWMGIAGYFGNVLAESADKLFRAFEKGAYYVDEHWNAITDNIIMAFKVGGLIIKTYIAQALARAILAPAMMIGGAAAGKGKKIFKFFGKANRKHRQAMDDAGPMGKFGKLGKYLRILWLMAGPAAIAFVALAAALSVIGFAAAAVAAYIVQNWTKISKSIIDGWDEVAPVLQRVYLKAMALWDMMVLVGEALLGSAAGASGFITILSIMEEMLITAAGAIIFFTKMLGKITEIRQWGYEQQRGETKLRARIAETNYEQAVEQYGTADPRVKEYQIQMRETAETAREAHQAANANMLRTYRLQKAVENLEKLKTAKASKERIRAAAEKLATVRELIAGGGAEGTQPPTGGVHVENMYNQWDLRNTDPDRLMSAFLPKLTDLADKRTQGRDMTPQGQ